MTAIAIPDTFPILEPLTERAEGKTGPWLIMEGGRGGRVSCFVDTYRLEERTKGKGWVEELPDGRFRVKAKAQHTGVKNRNGRIYPRHVWEQHLRESAPFRQSLRTRRIIGHLEHPEDGKSQMPLGAIVITEAFPPDENGEVYIIFETMLTPGGKVVEAYIRSRVGFGLSSRGNGSVITRNGIDEVQGDFEPVTWDCVIQESTPGAEVEALRESWQDRPGTPEEFARYLREARDELVTYVDRVIAKADGDADKARALIEADNFKAASAIDCSDMPGGCCTVQISEDVSEDVPPSGYSKYLLGFEDESAHYRAYQGSTGQWEVWMHPHNLPPERLASKIPTLDACRQVAENHYKLVLASGAQSAQDHAAQSNMVAQDAAQGVSTVNAPGTVPSLQPAHSQQPMVVQAPAPAPAPQVVVMPVPIAGMAQRMEEPKRDRPSKIVLDFSESQLQERGGLPFVKKMLRGRRCFTREEAIEAAKAVERALKRLEGQVTIRGTHKKGILQLLWWARTAKKPEDRIDNIIRAIDMMAPLSRTGPGSRYIKPEKDPRLGHLLGASRMEAVRKAWPAVRAQLQEQFKIQQSIPFSGSVCELELSSGDERKKAHEALDEAGFFVEEVDATHLRVYTTFDDEEQACQHVERVLRGKGMKHQQMESVGIIEDGQVFLEDDMGNLTEYAPDKRSHGPGMAGGDTVPDDDQSASGAPASSTDRALDTGHYQGMDPEDLDLDLDVNEGGIDYPFDEMEEQKLKRGVLTPVSPSARKAAGMKPIKRKGGLVPLTPAARKSMGMPSNEEYDEYDDMDEMGMGYGDDEMEYEAYSCEADDYDDDDMEMEMYESELDESPASRAAEQAMFAKAFARTPKSKSTGKPTNPRNQADNARRAASKDSKVGRNYRKFRSRYAAKHGLQDKPIIGRGERKAKPKGPARRMKKKKRNESMEHLDESPSSRAAEQAMFAKAFARTPKSKSTGKPTNPRNQADNARRAASKDSKVGRNYRKFRSRYAAKHGLQDKPIIGRGERKAKPKGPARRMKKKKRNESLVENVIVRHDPRDGENLGAVRVWEHEDGTLHAMEFYSPEGILESIFDGEGDPIYVAEEAEYFDPDMVEAEDDRDLSEAIEVWEDEHGNLHGIFEEDLYDLDEEELPTRHGGKTGVEMKGDQWQGKSGPEYNVSDLPDGGDRGEEGDGLKPGTYHQATEDPGANSQDGGGQHVKKGTWPTSGDSASGMPSGKGKASSKDGDGGAKAKKMAERVQELEAIVAMRDDQLAEADAELDAMRESQRQQEVDYARARLFQMHPELKLAEDRFLCCESVQELRDEASAMLRLMEAQQPKTQPNSGTTVQPLNESQPEPKLSALSGRPSAASGSQQQGVPTGPLNESMSPSDGLRGVVASRSRGAGDVASRTAAHRKRRMRSRRQGH